MDLFKRKKKQEVVLAPALMHEENPVNYSSVLDYLVGLSKEEYDKLIKVTTIYRDANRKAATILDVEDQPTTQLVEPKPSDDEIDHALDGALAGIGYEETSNQPVVVKPQKEQAPSPEKKIDVKQN